MDANVLKEKNFTRLVIKYTGNNGESVRTSAALKYFDTKTCFIGFLLKLKYIQPKKRSLVEIKAYTDNGIYTTEVKLRDTNMYANEIILEVETPKTWKYIQRRAGTRRDLELPITVKFNEDLKFDTVSTNLSVGGISFLTDKKIPEEYKHKPFTIIIKFPSNILINFKDDMLNVTVKIIRTTEFDDGTIYYGCNYIALQPGIKEMLKRYIMLAR